MTNSTAEQMTVTSQNFEEGVQRFAGQTVIVTGAGSGIGRATALQILAEGGRVIAVDISRDRLSELESMPSGERVVTVRADVTDEEDIKDVVDSIGDSPIAGLANIAGITDGHRPLHETEDEIWQRVMAVNVDGPFRLTRAVVSRMLAGSGGAVVNVASEASLRGNAAGTAYTVSKHAIVGLTRSAAFLYGSEGIRVNAVAPGPVATGIEGAFASEYSQQRLGPFMRMIPPIAEPEAIAASITWLLSAESHNVNGVVLPSDGGWSVQ
ncbi:SDR family NAD(P)-dependent oxidoreductase [Brevibacterium sp. CFH 10365]|uniref:SDR family NAD(P)-dependent oxidoreductase n=1 Tax=Brevibacterium sp. CFH 10365 TaxID=2585207 RepID=UPI001D0CE6A9|nr:SDR family oxidoreductase [Brevibacterium sp. CFH 10365]